MPTFDDLCVATKISLFANMHTYKIHVAIMDWLQRQADAESRRTRKTIKVRLRISR
jgi:hypothetical protein